LRRIVLVVTALFVLGAAATAYAAINTYQATISFTSKKPGTAKKPVPVGYNQDITVSPGTPGNRTAILKDIKTTIYGITADGKDFPTCSLAKIAKAKNDSGCPKKAEVAAGYIKATLGDPTNFATGGAACDPALDVWNAGQGKLVFFFVTNAAHQCLGGSLKTGSTPPYPGTYKTHGKNLVVDVPIPDTINYPLGLSGALVGSLSFEHLKWFKSTTKKNGKTVAALSSVGCKGKKRPYSMSFTSTLPGQANETDSVSHTAPCS
jgi:hypothetical protein